MRFPRVKAEGQSFYHCVSRAVDGAFIFQITGHGSPEAERFVQLMRLLEAFSGVRVLIYVLMSNHFHLLCEVPQARELSEAELLDRIQAGYGPARRQALEQELAHLRQEPDGAEQIQQLLQPYRNRMFDLSIFIKEELFWASQMPSPGKKSVCCCLVVSCQVRVALCFVRKLS